MQHALQTIDSNNLNGSKAHYAMWRKNIWDYIKSIKCFRVIVGVWGHYQKTYGERPKTEKGRNKCWKVEEGVKWSSYSIINKGLVWQSSVLNHGSLSNILITFYLKYFLCGCVPSVLCECYCSYVNDHDFQSGRAYKYDKRSKFQELEWDHKPQGPVGPSASSYGKSGLSGSGTG